MKSFIIRLHTVFPLISAQGAYKIKKWHCLINPLFSAPSTKLEKEWNTKELSKIKGVWDKQIQDVAQTYRITLKIIKTGEETKI